MTEKWLYDIEIFPNFSSFTFKNPDTGEIKVFAIFKHRNDRIELCEFIDREILLIGYNNISFDGAILTYLLENKSNLNITKELFDLSQRLISDDSRCDGRITKLRYPKNVKFKQMDLLKIMAFDKVGVSLKQIAINLKWHKIQDLPFAYDKKIKDEKEASIVLKYNLNDVLISEKLYKRIQAEIELRKDLSEIYGIDFTNASDSKIANLILEDIYAKETKQDIREIRDLRTERDNVSLKDCIGQNIEFQTKELNHLKQSIENIVVRKENGFKYKKKLIFGNREYEIGIGGLHSVDDARLYKSNENYIVLDQDVSSFYPNIIINNKICPEHLGKTSVDILEKITKERINAKKSGDKIKAAGLKISANAYYGKFGFDSYWLYDPKALLTVTVSGQLYLLMLIEALNLAGIEVISANTDGVIAKIPNHLKEKHQEICDWWQKKTNFELEFTEYETYARSDVNNYVTKKTTGEIKSKGRYVTEVDLKKGYNHPVVAKCLYEYFINDKPVKQTLSENKDVLDYCMSQKMGKDFMLEYHYDDKIENLQKTNRFYVSTKGGTLIKHHTIRDNNIGILVGKKVQILNNYSEDFPFESYDIDFDFYEEEANKYIQEVIPDNTEYNYIFSENDESNYIENPETEEDNAARNELLLSLEGIKNLNTDIVGNLIRLNKEFTENDFLDMLIYAEENHLISAKFSDLIKIGYFSKYGKNKKLLAIFDEFRNGPNKYTSKLSEKSKAKRLLALKETWKNIPDKSLSISEQINADIKILGKLKSNFDGLNKRYCYVEDIGNAYGSKRTNIKLYCLANTKSQEFKIWVASLRYNDIDNETGKKVSKSLNIGDVIYCENFSEEYAIKYINGEKTKTDKKEWWLNKYTRLSEKDIDKIDIL